MFKILPYENITLVTKLKPEEIYQKLLDATEPKRTGLFSQRTIFSSRTEKIFEGTVQKQSFEFGRIIYYGNSFLPNIKGHVEQQVFRSEIHVKFRMPILVIVFTCIWLGMGSIAFFIILFMAPSIPFIIFPLIMLLFGFGFFIIPFKFAVKKAKNILKKLLQAEIKNER